MSASLAHSIRQRIGRRVIVQGYGQQYCLALNTDEIVVREDFLQFASSMFDADTLQALRRLHTQHQRNVATISSQPQHPATTLRPMIRFWTNSHIHIYGTVGLVGALLTLIALLIVLLM